jgi:hypothetical protein
VKPSTTENWIDIPFKGCSASFNYSGSVEKPFKMVPATFNHQRQDAVPQVLFCYPEAMVGVGGRRCK